MEPVEHRYGDEESARIIRRALEIQSRERSGEVGGRGLTLSDIEGVARESGIDPDLVRRAALELSEEGAWRHRGVARLFFGGPIRVTDSLCLRTEVDRPLLESLLAPLSAITGDEGSGSVVGRSLMWKTGPLSIRRSGRSLSITVSPIEGGGAEVRGEENLSGVAGGIFGGLVGGLGLGGGLGVGLGVGIAVLASPLFAVLIPIGALLGGWQLARGIFALIRRRTERRVSRILKTIHAALESAPPRA